VQINTPSDPTLAAAYAKLVSDYERDLEAWKVKHEAARSCVDRIAFSGQAPCHVTGAFQVGDYIVAAPNGGGIKAVAVKPADMTLELYMRRVGKVWAVTEATDKWPAGMAWVDVQHG
jgi:hypothetical protein